MGQATPPLQALGNIYLPTAEACWDYGITRDAPLLPFIGSLLPYTFLRGVQFDTKVFKLSELVPSILAATTGAIMSRNSRNEIKLTPSWECNDSAIKLKKAFTRSVPVFFKTSGFPGIGMKMQTLDLLPQSLLDQYNILTTTTMNIALDSDNDFSFKVNNTWKSGEDIITNFITGAVNVAKNLTENYRTAKGVSDSNQNTVATIPFSQARYSSTEFGELTINFTLFTRNNYLRDIYLPLLYLQAMCIPKRHPEAEKYKKKAANKAADVAATSQEYIQKLFNSKKKAFTADDVKNMAANLMDYFRVVKPPDTFSVEHSSGLFWMKKGAVTSFNFKVDGPWVRMEYDALFGKLFNTFGGAENPSSIATALDRLLQDVYVKFLKYPDQCYPTRVKCSMTLKELDFLTIEDWQDRDINKIASKIKTSIAALQSPSVGVAGLIAGGIAQNLDILVPDIKGAGDLLSGGKWVPPGESVSGIPGFL